MAEVKIYWQEYTEEALQQRSIDALNNSLQKEFQLDIKKSTVPQKISFFSKLMLNQILEKDFAISNPLKTFQKDEHGKPSIIANDLHFNISHSNKIISVAVCENAAVGIDVQLIKKYSERVTSKVFTENEKNLYNASKDKQSFFFDTWSKKEASVKATGKGIKTGLSQFSVIENIISVDQKTIHLQKIEIKKGYSSAIALGSPISKVIIKENKLGL